mgnify:CR=1 FL=1
MATLLLLTSRMHASSEVLPALGLLSHQVKVLGTEPSALVDAPPADVILVDARRDLPAAKSLCRLLRTTGVNSPVFVITTEGGLAALTADWGVDDVLIDTSGPAEVEARIRMATGRLALEAGEAVPHEINSGPITIDESSYAGKGRGRTLDLTFKEFELPLMGFDRCPNT